MYVGIIWFVFHVLQLLSIRFTQQNLCCIRKFMMKYIQKRIENWISLIYLWLLGAHIC